MGIEDYLKEIEFAVKEILLLIWNEYGELEKINLEMAKLSKKNWQKIYALQGINVDLQTLNINKVKITGKKPNNLMFKEEEKLCLLNDKAKIIQHKIIARQFSVDALSGMLLHFAKQGISLTYGNLKNCPDGRFVGSQSIKEIIWYGRNQSIHWEEKINSKEEEFFKKLKKEFSFEFAGFKQKNLGFNILKLLEWKTFKDFKDDMLLLK
jgi:hypothetical protein